MNINFKMRNLEQVQKKLKNLPNGAKKIVLPAISEYLIGDDRHGLRHYPPVTTQKYVRTNTLKEGWQIVGDVYRQRIINLVSYAKHVPNVWGPGGWINYNWRQWADVIQSNMAGAMRHANAKLKMWLANY